VAWHSGNGVGCINEVTLCRARLVLGWVTRPGSTPGGGTLFRYVTSVTQVDSAFYPPWDGKMSTSQRAVMFCYWGVKAGMV